jgi:hypothetical protein
MSSTGPSKPEEVGLGAPHFPRFQRLLRLERLALGAHNRAPKTTSRECGLRMFQVCSQLPQ